MVITEQLTKRIFNKEIATELVTKGFRAVKTEIHKDNPNWLIFHFVDTNELRKEFTNITNRIKANKNINKI